VRVHAGLMRRAAADSCRHHHDGEYRPALTVPAPATVVQQSLGKAEAAERGGDGSKKRRASDPVEATTKFALTC
jgi:hypothetical protein